MPQGVVNKASSSLRVQALRCRTVVLREPVARWERVRSSCVKTSRPVGVLAMYSLYAPKNADSTLVLLFHLANTSSFGLMSDRIPQRCGDGIRHHHSNCSSYPDLR